jgi:dolichol-phosphate mannosyltransferase
VRAGLAAVRRDRVEIIRADGSDDPEDVVRFHRKIGEGFDRVLAARFARGARSSTISLTSWY